MATTHALKKEPSIYKFNMEVIPSFGAKGIILVVESMEKAQNQGY